VTIYIDESAGYYPELSRLLNKPSCLYYDILYYTYDTINYSIW